MRIDIKHVYMITYSRFDMYANFILLSHFESLCCTLASLAWNDVPVLSTVTLLR